MESVRPRLVGRLYYRFIAGTMLEKDGWQAQDMANLLERLGMVDLVECEPRNSCYKAGAAKANDRSVLQLHYVEKTPLPSKAVVIKLAKDLGK